MAFVLNGRTARGEAPVPPTPVEKYAQKVNDQFVELFGVSIWSFTILDALGDYLGRKVLALKAAREIGKEAGLIPLDQQ